MSLITLKGSLQDHINLNTVKNDIVTYIQTIPNYQLLKNDVELYELIYRRLLDDLKLTIPPDYSQIVIDILTIVFGISETERAGIYKVLQYLQFNKLVKKSGVLKKTASFVSNSLGRNSKT
jgi:hypothetical protein